VFVNIQFLFARLKKSEFVERYLREKLEGHLERFHHLRTLRAFVKIEMENSPQHRGKDSFSCMIRISSPFFKNVVVQKQDTDVYAAIGQVLDKLTIVLSKVHSARVKERRRNVHIEELALTEVA
jgi:ribosomal subunit interface protein